MKMPHPQAAVKSDPFCPLSRPLSRPVPSLALLVLPPCERTSSDPTYYTRTDASRCPFHQQSQPRSSHHDPPPAITFLTYIRGEPIHPSLNTTPLSLSLTPLPSSTPRPPSLQHVPHDPPLRSENIKTRTRTRIRQVAPPRRLRQVAARRLRPGPTSHLSLGPGLCLCLCLCALCALGLCAPMDEGSVGSNSRGGGGGGLWVVGWR